MRSFSAASSEALARFKSALASSMSAGAYCFAPALSAIEIAAKFLDRSGMPPGAGALFGLAVVPGGSGVYYVDDAVNTLRLLH